jgi:hypothetical protein
MIFTKSYGGQNLFNINPLQGDPDSALSTCMHSTAESPAASLIGTKLIMFFNMTVSYPIVDIMYPAGDPFK